jgi:hypothetical protein
MLRFMLAGSLLFSIQAYAATVYKCKDANGQTTFSYQACINEGKQNANDAKSGATRELLIGGWIATHPLMRMKVGLHSDGSYYSETQAILGTRIISLGSWELQGDNLVIKTDKEIKVVQSNIREKRRNYTRRVTVSEFKPDAFTTVAESAFGYNDETRYQKVEELYHYIPLDPLKVAEEMHNNIISGCDESFENGMYDIAQMLCKTASDHNSGAASYRMAQMIWSGMGTNISEPLAHQYFDLARSQGYEAASADFNSQFTEYMRRWPFGESENPEDIIGSWCVNTSGPSLDKMSADKGRLIIRTDGTYNYIQGALKENGRWKQQRNTLKLSKSGELGILSKTRKAMLLRNDSSNIELRRGNCDEKSREQSLALMLDNSIVTANQPLIDTIIASGHNLDIGNEASMLSPTPLIQAVKSGDKELVERLLKAGVDTMGSDSTGRTALEHARAEHEDEIIRLLENPKVGSPSFHSQQITQIPAEPDNIAVPEALKTASRERLQKWEKDMAVLRKLDPKRLYSPEQMAQLMISMSCSNIRNPESKNENPQTLAVKLFSEQNNGILDERKLDLSMRYYNNDESFQKIYDNKIAISVFACTIGV